MYRPDDNVIVETTAEIFGVFVKFELGGLVDKVRDDGLYDVIVTLPNGIIKRTTVGEKSLKYS